MSYEEDLVQEILDQSETCLDKSDVNSAINLLKEAELMQQWQYIYGAAINVNLAYAYALKGDFELATQCLSKMDNLYGAEWLIEKERSKAVDTRMMIEAYKKNDNLVFKKKSKHEGKTIIAAHEAMSEFDYEKCMDICLELIKVDYDHPEAHILLQEVFIKLGIRNSKVEAARKKLANLMLNRPESGL